MRPLKFGIGQSALRVEDNRLITGAGAYPTDYLPAGTLNAVVLRAPIASGRFTIGDLATARAMPGVKLILTAAEVTSLGDIPCKGAIKNGDGSAMPMPRYPVLANGTVRHIGEAIAFIVAETVEQARDAAEAIPVDYADGPAVIDAEAALEPGAPLVHAEAPGNIAVETGIGDLKKTEKAFAKAHRVVSVKLVNNRLVTNYMEPRSVVAEYDASGGRWTLTLGSQGSHGLRDILAKNILKVDTSRVRVVTPDVGGGFGTKAFMYREYPLAALAAQMLGRPVRWVQERAEHFLSCAHGRDNIVTVEVALDKRGRFLALKADLIANLGAYLSQYAPFIPWIGATMLTGLYRIPVGHIRIREVYTHTVPVDAYRGAGRPECAYMIERLVDAVAYETGKSPAEVRALNFIKPEEMPYKTVTGRVYDSGEFEGHMRAAMERADWAGFKDRLKAAKKRGRIRGIGLASYIEACGGGGAEPAFVNLEMDGTVTVRIGTQSNGQGHETAYAQLVSEHLDIPLERIRVRQGDTDDLAEGGGTGGSRSIPVGGAAVDGAARTLADNLKELAGEALEAGSGDLEIVGGAVRVAGTDRALDFTAIARLPGATKEKLNVTGSFSPPEATYPNGTHCVEVEIDPETGDVGIANYVIVDDFGVTLNPLMLAGQIHGGSAQGIGQALTERTVFSDDGQLLTASFLDYAMPRADDIPTFQFETRNVPCTTNALGVKGAGEAGAIGACPAVMNAIVDALNRAYGIRALDMPATPERVWEAIRAAKPH